MTLETLVRSACEADDVAGAAGGEDESLAYARNVVEIAGRPAIMSPTTVAICRSRWITVAQARTTAYARERWIRGSTPSRTWRSAAWRSRRISASTRTDVRAAA